MKIIRTILIILSVSFGSVTDSEACAFFDSDYEYYNLFIQELIDDPQYYPFLLSYSSRYYDTNRNKESLRNENIEEWAAYWDLDYNDSYYLVFSVSEEELSRLLSGKTVTDKKLQGISANFVKKYKEALQYLLYAKHLEPYMRISNIYSEWNDSPSYTVDSLSYEVEVNEMKKRWQHAKEKELKLRYGYQLVRLAHYSLQYQEAIGFFEHYVESLDYRPAMYYHALSQKAGAERGQGDLQSSVWHFFQVFVHSRNLKETAYTSIHFNDNVDFAAFLERATTQDELNNIYLLLGYAAFNNPLNEARKILAVSPDAIQAKVLIARGIDQIEREMMPDSYWGGTDNKVVDADRRYPLVGSNIRAFLEDMLALTNEMADSDRTKDKNFWFITASYLHLLNKDFEKAQQLLGQVVPADDLYKQQKQHLAMLIDLSRPSRITPEVEIAFYEKYADGLSNRFSLNEYYTYSDKIQHTAYSTNRFVQDVLANRYYLQGDYAKSFLLSNPLVVLENNPQLELQDAIDAFLKKPDKNAWEEGILSKAIHGIYDVPAYLTYLYGIVYLTNGELEKAHDAFSKTGYTSGALLTSDIFGYNRIECFECPYTMAVDYLSDFSFMADTMTFEELTGILIALNNVAGSKNKQAAKANYLLGNFFYNVSESGYFRHVLRFGDDNGYYSERYHSYVKPDQTDQIYFKYYGSYYKDTNPIAQRYLEKAYGVTSDDELKARIVFALSKCEQHAYNFSNRLSYSWWSRGGDNILISDRTYFNELMRYQNTDFFDTVRNCCKYFDYYVMNCVE